MATLRDLIKAGFTTRQGKALQSLSAKYVNVFLHSQIVPGESPPGVYDTAVVRPEGTSLYSATTRVSVPAGGTVAYLQAVGDATLTYAQLDVRRADNAQYLALENDNPMPADAPVMWDAGVIDSRGTDLVFHADIGTVTSTAGGVFDINLVLNLRP